MERLKKSKLCFYCLQYKREFVLCDVCGFGICADCAITLNCSDTICIDCFPEEFKKAAYHRNFKRDHEPVAGVIEA